jgi:Tfp pilus assembly protein FimV
VVASAAAVVALGLLARAFGPDTAATDPIPSAPAAITAAPGETVWEVAARLAPGRPGPEVAALAERLVAENDLTSARLRPGQVLRVTLG